MYEFGKPAFFGKAMENVCWAGAGMDLVPPSS
jgi:hypothetical protein